MRSFENSVAFITGAGGGMGKAAAIRFAQEGAFVFAVDLSQALLQATKQEAASLGVTIEVCPANISDAQSVQEAMDQCVAKLGGLNILVNFAGITQNKRFEELSIQEWERMLNVNLTGTFLTSQAAFRHMKNHGGGCITNISSAAIYSGGGHIGTAHYTASKAGVVGLSRAIAKEGAPYQIRCNTICPGLTETGMTASFLETAREQSVQGIPLGRVGTPLDIVEAVLYLSSQQASYVTGTILNVNGGLVMH